MSGHWKKSESCLRRHKCGLALAAPPLKKQKTNNQQQQQHDSTQKFKDYCKSEENTAEERGVYIMAALCYTICSFPLPHRLYFSDTFAQNKSVITT